MRRIGMVETPSVWKAVEAARVARKANRLRVALRALDHAYRTVESDAAAQAQVVRESADVARALEERGAPIAALAEWLRARDARGAPGSEAEDGVKRLVEGYARWRPATAPIGAPRDGLTAGASGAFWIDRSRRGRVVTLEGGITGEGTEAFTRVLELCAEGVDWVFVDMKKLTYVGSTGLAVAVKTSERLKSRGGGMSLFSLSSNLRLLVDTLGLSGFLHPAEGLLQAIDLATGTGSSHEGRQDRVHRPA